MHKTISVDENKLTKTWEKNYQVASIATPLPTLGCDC
jgi:hypothetical protein